MQRDEIMTVLDDRWRGSCSAPPFRHGSRTPAWTAVRASYRSVPLERLRHRDMYRFERTEGVRDQGQRTPG